MLDNFLDTLKNTREWKVKVTTSKNVVYTEADISSLKIINKQDSAQLIGATAGRELTLECLTSSVSDFSGLLTVELGLKTWNPILEEWYYEWRTLGNSFKADTIEQTNRFTTTITAYDRMCYGFNESYLEGDANSTTNVNNLCSHIQSKFNITFNMIPINFEVHSIYNLTYREIIGYLAVLLGANAFYSYDSNQIKFVPIARQTVDLEVGKEFYFEFEDDRAEVQIKKINLDMGGGFGYYAGSSDAEENEQVIVELPFASQVIANHVFYLIEDYKPCGYNLRFLGNPCLEPYDKVRLTTYDDKVYILDCSSIETNFNGGFSQTLSAEKVTEETSGGSYVENKLQAKINVLSDRISMEVSDLTDELNQTKTSFQQTTDAITSRVESIETSIQDNRALSVVLDNEFSCVSTNAEGYPLENGSFESKVRAFYGNEELTTFELSVSATSSYGLNVSVDNTNKKVVFSYATSRRITKNGDEISVFVRANNETIERKIGWSRVTNGVDGTSFNIKGSLDNVNQLPSTTATQGDAYIIDGDLYVYGENNEWVNVGRIQGEDGKSISCHIVANSLIFKSGDGGETYSPSTITLTPICTNCNFSSWQYYRNNQWTAVNSTLLDGNNVVIPYNSSFLSGNSLTFKALTDVEGCIDIATITKISALDNELETIREISNSLIEQSSNQILQTVKTTYLRKDEAGDWITESEASSLIDQKAGDITLSVKTMVEEEVESVVGDLEFDPRNLVLNSMVKETSNAYGFANREVLKLEDNTTYVLSANGFATSTNGVLRVRLSEVGKSTAYQEIVINSSTEKTEYVTFKTGNVSSNRYEVKALLSPSGATGTATINWYKVNKGNFTDWSPAPEDIQNQFDAIEDMGKDLQNQMDGKIQTYYQPNDPSVDWNASEKDFHVGDLWYDINSVKMKRWNGTSWVIITDKDASDAKQLASTKAQVFTSTPTPPYYKGDLWCRASDEEIMRSKANRTSGSYVASDWVKASKYTDDTTANNIADDLANNYYSKTETEQKIQIAQGFIESTVSKTYTTKDEFGNTLTNYAKKSDLSQTAEDITATFTSSGGGNLVKNGELKNGTKFWTEHPYNLVGSDLNHWWRVQNNQWTGYEPALELGIPNMTSGEYGVYQTIETVVGRQYVLTCYLAGHRGNYYAVVRGTESGGAWGWLASRAYGHGYGGSNPDDWYKVVIPFVAERTETIIDFHITSSTGNNTYMWVKRIMVCEGTVWSPFVPHSSEVYTGITKIDQDGIEVSHSNANTKSKMSADGFSVLDENGDTIAWLTAKNTWTEIKADKVFATNVDNVYIGDANLFVDHSKTAVGDGSSNSPFNNFKALADYLQDAPILKKDLTINVVSTDKVTDHFDLRGIRGNGTIRINLAKTLVLNDTGDNSAFYFYGCDVPITINGGRSGYDSTDGALLNGFNYGVFFNQCKYGCVEYLAIDTSGAGSEQWGVIFRGTNGMTRRVDFMGSWNAVLADYGSNVSDHDSCGNCKNAFYAQSGANIVLGSTSDNGYKPHGQYVRNVGCVTDLGNRSATASKRSTTSLPPTSDKWQSFSYSDYGYFTPGTDDGTNQNAWNPNGKKVYQGSWGWGNNRGIFTLPNSEINAYLSGATILDGSTITLKRADDSGNWSPQWIQLCGTTHTKIGTGTPPVTKTYAWLGELDIGEKKTFTLPKAFVQDLKSGVIKSVMFYTSDGSYYVKFDPVCTLNIKVNK